MAYDIDDRYAPGSLELARPRSVVIRRGRRTASRPVGLPVGQDRMAGPTGPATTTEAVGDPDSTSEASQVEGGIAAGAVIGSAVAGPVGFVVGTVAGALAGSVAAPPEAGPDIDSFESRAAHAVEPTRPVAGPMMDTSSGEPHDPLSEAHAVDIPVVDLIPGSSAAGARARPDR